MRLIPLNLARIICIIVILTITTAINTPSLHAAPMSPGVIRVVKIIGLVTAIEKATERSIELNTGDRLKEGYAVETGPESQATLLFSNGATISMDQNSKFSIDEFIQEPFQTNRFNLAQIQKEPTSSRTRVYVNYGQVRGSVKGLNTLGGSRYDIGSPIGIAGIRGTTYELVISKIGSDFTGTFTIVEGQAFFISRNNNYLPVESNSQVTIGISTLGSEVLTTSSLDPNLAASISSATGSAQGSFSDLSALEFDASNADVPTDTTSTDSTSGDAVDNTADSTTDSSDSSTSGDAAATTTDSNVKASSSAASTSEPASEASLPIETTDLPETTTEAPSASPATGTP